MSTDTREALAALRYALERADQFITNGIALGFIRMPDKDCPDTAHETPGIIRAALATQPAQPSAQGEPSLHPATAELVRRFAQALAEKLAAAEAKYGYSDGWASPDWMDECRAKLMEHIAKGDPRDVAAYCAFLWHHGASTAQPSAQGEAVALSDDDTRSPFDIGLELIAQGIPQPSAPAAPVSAQGEAVVWQWRHFLGNPDVIEPFWTEWEPCTERQYQYALATPDHEGRALCEMPLASAPAAPAQAVPLTDAQTIALWHQDHEAHQRLSAFEWFAAGVIAAETAHKISTGEVG